MPLAADVVAVGGVVVTLTELPGLLAVIEVCVWQRAVTTKIFCPVDDQAWDADSEVDQGEDVPSPQLKLY